MSFQLAIAKSIDQKPSFLPSDQSILPKSNLIQTIRFFPEVGYFNQKQMLSLDEQLFDAKANCKIKISEVSMYIPDEWRKGLYSQINNMMDVENWDNEDKPITTLSFTTFLKFLMLIKPTRRPGLGVANTGNVIAAWLAGDARLTIECLAQDSVRWVLSHNIDGIRETASGVAQLTRIKTVLSPFSPEVWFENL